MAMEIRYTTNALQLRDTIERIRANFPKVANRDLKKMTEIYSRAFASEIKTRNLIETNALYKSVLKVRKSKKGYKIHVLRYGINLSLMKKDHKIGPDTKGRESFDKYMLKTFGFTKPYLKVRALKRHQWFNPALKTGTKRVLNYFERTKMQKLFTSGGRVL